MNDPGVSHICSLMLYLIFFSFVQLTEPGKTELRTLSQEKPCSFFRFSYDKNMANFDRTYNSHLTSFVNSFREVARRL